MSRVTIGKLAGDFNSATFQERQKTKDIEVVPRKVVEDIIDACKMYQKTILHRTNDEYRPIVDIAADNGQIAALGFAMNVATQYLQDFEEGEEA